MMSCDPYGKSMPPVVSTRSPQRLRFPISANPIEALRFAAFAARLAERRSAEEIALDLCIDAMSHCSARSARSR